MKRRTDSIVIQRRTVSKMVLNDDGSFYETVNHGITVKYDGFDSPVDWEKVYDSVVDVVRNEAFKHL